MVPLTKEDVLSEAEMALGSEAPYALTNPWVLPAAPAAQPPEPAPAITQKQLQALTRKHLLLMLRDSEAELQKTKKLLEEYQKLLEHWQGRKGVNLYAQEA